MNQQQYDVNVSAPEGIFPSAVPQKVDVIQRRQNNIKADFKVLINLRSDLLFQLYFPINI